MKTTMTTLATFAILVLARQASAAPIEWSIGGGGNGHAYDLITTGGITWHDAKDAAAILIPPAGFDQWHLVSFSHQTELNFVIGNFGAMISGGGDGAWAGFTDESIEGRWQWIDDTPGIWEDPDNFPSPVQTAFTSWAASEPNDSFGEDFLAVRSNGSWNDLPPNNGGNHLYLVEFEPIPEPSALTLATCALLGLAYGRRKRQ